MKNRLIHHKNKEIVEYIEKFKANINTGNKRMWKNCIMNKKSIIYLLK